MVFFGMMGIDFYLFDLITIKVIEFQNFGELGAG
jgi:hypothetical protein